MFESARLTDAHTLEGFDRGKDFCAAVTVHRQRRRLVMLDRRAPT